MLEFQNVTIEFDKKVLDSAYFRANRGEITCIIGDSGSGKTSLLYGLGLFATYEGSHYTFDGNFIDLNNDKQIDDFRYEHLSYVLQDNNVIDSITVEKNIAFMLSMNQEVTINLDSLLKKVELTDKKQLYPPSLSGGERQRLALACAMAKNRDIFLGDEITSSLDLESKTIILRILQDMAKENRVVIIVSHDEEMIRISDVVYEIENKKLQLVKHDIVERNILPYFEHTKKETKSQFSYFIERYNALFLSNRKLLGRKIVLIIISSILSLAGISIIHAGNKANKKIIENVNTISNRELYLINQYDFQVKDNNNIGVISTMDGSGQPPLTNEIDEKLKNIKNVSAIYEIYNFKSSEISIKSGKQEEGYLDVIRNGVRIEKRAFNEEEQNIGYTYNYAVKPFFKEQNWFQKGNNGIYVNEEFAHTFSANIGDVLHFQAFVPVAMNLSEGVYYTNEEEKIPFQGSLLVYTPVDFEFPILDIVNTANTTGGYVLQNNMYMDYNLMMEIMNEHKITNFDEYEQSNNWYGSFEEVASSIRILFADKYQSVPEIKKEITEISNHIAIGYDYQDIDTLYKHLNQSSTLSVYYGLGSILIVIVLINLLGLLQMKSFNSHILIMKLNGVTKKQILQYFIFDNLIIVFYSMLFILLIYQLALLPFMMMNPMQLPMWYLTIYDYLNFPFLYLFYIILLLFIAALSTYMLYDRNIARSKVDMMLRGTYDSN